MSHSVIIHISGEQAIMGEVDELPKPTDTLLTVNNPRLRDGKDIHYIEHNAIKVIWPIDKITLIEILESADEDKVIGFVRE